MNENIYAPPKADLSQPLRVLGAEPFYVVSMRKFTVMYFTTLGLFGFYWFYKNWRCYQQQGGAGNIWPVMRAIFSFLYVHALFDKVLAHAQQKQRPLDWNTRAHAGLLGALFLASWGINFVSDRLFGSPIAEILGLLLALVIYFCNASAVKQFNIACGDPAGEGNKAFTAANYGWIAFGCLLWILFAVGMLLPEEAA